MTAASHPAETVEERLNAIDFNDYETCKQANEEYFSSLFDRVTLNIAGGEGESLDITALQEEARRGNYVDMLIQKTFDFGRYLLISSSLPPGTLPANLQGIWGEGFDMPWGADFHTNINLQMNYWLLMCATWQKQQNWLNQFLEKLTIPGAYTARVMYNAGGLDAASFGGLLWKNLSARRHLGSYAYERTLAGKASLGAL